MKNDDCAGIAAHILVGLLASGFLKEDADTQSAQIEAACKAYQRILEKISPPKRPIFDKPTGHQGTF